MDQNPDQVSASLLEAADALQQGRSAAAVRILRQILPEPRDPELARGLELWRTDRPRQAARALEQSSLGQPGDFRVLQLRAQIAIRLGALDEAIELLQQCLALHPEIMAVRPELARLLMRRQRYAEAQEQLDRLLQSKPDDQEFLLLMAALMDRSGQYAEAIDLLQKVIDRRSAFGQTPGPDAAQLAANHTALGMIQRTAGQRPAAIESFRMAIKLDPGSGWPWFQLADLKVYNFQAQETEEIR